jgi:uncharacterized protein (DUF433 family)
MTDGNPIVAIDVDGVLHGHDAHFAIEDVREATMAELLAAGLFAHRELLADLLAPLPGVRLVVHSSWRRTLNIKALRAVLGPLGPRFAGVTPPEREREASLLEFMRRRQVDADEVVILDDQPALFDKLRHRVVASDPVLGISSARVQRAFVARLRDSLVRYDPATMGGTACFTGTRVPIQEVIAGLDAGVDFGRLRAAYPFLTNVHVEAAMRRTRPWLFAMENARQLVLDGELVPLEALATAWRTTPESLTELEQARELGSLDIDGQPYFAAQMLEVDQASARRICTALWPLSGGHAFIFWTRKHGALRGMTVAQALHDGIPLERIIELADDLRQERGG